LVPGVGNRMTQNLEPRNQRHVIKNQKFGNTNQN
jgi:hypothetical protein